VWSLTFPGGCGFDFGLVFCASQGWHISGLLSGYAIFCEVIVFSVGMEVSSVLSRVFRYYNFGISFL